MAEFCTYETAWCPGCGNFSILECLKTALEELGKEPRNVLVAAGIGQAAKIPQYISANAFCGLHGRALPAAIAAGAGFVARGFTGNKTQLISLMKQAIEYKGYALVDILQPCVSFNKINTFSWYKERVYELDADYDASNRAEAINKASEFGDKIPTGVVYLERKPTFHEKSPVLRQGGPLIDRKHDSVAVERLMKEFL